MKRLLAGALICLAASIAFADTIDPALAAADNAFALDLLVQLAKSEPGQNIFISPYSVSTILQILGNGATGKTKTEIQQVLKTDNFPPDKLNGLHKDLDHDLQSQSEVTLDLANAIWFETGIELKPAFVSTNKDFFQAELASVNFKTPEAADTINAWAKKNTQGKITDIVSFPFPDATQVILANAIYFKGKWAEPFDTNLTAPRDFYLAGGIVKQPRTMSQQRKLNYAETLGYQAVQLAYEGDRLQMMLFLPTTNSTPEKLLGTFSGTNWSEGVLWKFASREGKVEFPKFKLNYDVVLNDPLKALGMQQAFMEGSANFSLMTDEPLFISRVMQKSYVDVNEEGTEAAAVTAIIAVNSIVMHPLPPFEMIVNRPFVFMIADRVTGVILFAGIVNDPTL